MRYAGPVRVRTNLLKMQVIFKALPSDVSRIFWSQQKQLLWLSVPVRHSLSLHRLWEAFWASEDWLIMNPGLFSYSVAYLKVMSSCKLEHILGFCLIGLRQMIKKIYISWWEYKPILYNMRKNVNLQSFSKNTILIQ